VEVHAWVELIGFCPGIGDESLGVERFGDLCEMRWELYTFIIVAELIPRNRDPCFCNSTVVNGNGFLLLVRPHL
jgi:hypothetical protein